MTQQKPRKGFSILEVLIAMIIIGVLTMILVPTLSNRAAQARLTACEESMERLADAQERCVIDFGYYVRLHVLDDVRGGDGIAQGTTNPAETDVIDGIRDEPLNELYENPERLFINPATNQFLNDNTQTLMTERIRANETIFGWNGPYVTWKDDEELDIDDNIGNQPFHLHDQPNDPWGNDFILVTYDGYLKEPEGVFDDILTWEGSGGATLNFDVEKRFDRPAIISLGPDGRPGSDDPANPDNEELGMGDDLVRDFGY